MEISGTRKNNVDLYLRDVPVGADVVVALTDLAQHEDRLHEIGFSDGLSVGETVLPLGVGPVSRYNAEGDYIIHKDRPKEQVSRQMFWTWEQWRGRDTETHYGVVDVPYERYPRTFREPPSVELTIAEAASGAKTVIAPSLANTDENKGAILHRINLFLDLFGSCSTLTEELEPYLRIEFRRYNWEILPPGEMPWPQLQRRLEPVLDQMGERTKPVAEYRLQLFTETFTPSFTAVGRAGFSGYLVFGYEDRGINIVESLQYGNATYVFGDDWQRLSQMTKAEILRDDLQDQRIIHREGWENELRQLLKSG